MEFNINHEPFTWAPTQGPLVALSLNGSVCSDGSTLTQQPERNDATGYKAQAAFITVQTSRNAPSCSAKSPVR